MGSIVDQLEGREAADGVRCPICGQENGEMRHCRHVRWMFDQGHPLDFARFAVETSPYTRARGFAPRDIPNIWWDQHLEWVVDQVMLHFDARDGYVFGEVADLDLLVRDVWRAFHPEPARLDMARVDPA
jgi:hypothetical protein